MRLVRRRAVSATACVGEEEKDYRQLVAELHLRGEAVDVQRRVDRLHLQAAGECGERDLLEFRVQFHVDRAQTPSACEGNETGTRRSGADLQSRSASWGSC